MNDQDELNAELGKTLRDTSELQRDFGKEALGAGMEILLAGREFVNVLLQATINLPKNSGATIQEVAQKLLDGKEGVVPKAGDISNTLLFLWEAQTVTIQKAIPLLMRWNELWFKMVDGAIPK